MISKVGNLNPQKLFRNGLEVYALTIAILSIFMVSIDMAMVNTAIPALSKAFQLSPNQASLALLSFYLALSSTVIIFGKLSDIVGTIRIFQIGCIFFVLGSLLSSFSTNIYELMVFRFFQGIGGATLLPIHGTIITNFLSKQHSGKYFGLITFFTGVSYAVGFMLGGILCHLSWRLLFLVNIPFGILALVIAWKLAKNIKQKVQPLYKAAIDYYSFGLIFVIFFFLTYFLNQFFSITLVNKIYILVVVVLLSILFLLRRKWQKTNLLNFKPFTNYQIIIPMVAIMLVNIVFDGINFISPFYLHVIKKISYNKIGFILAVFPIASMVVGPITGYYLDKIGSYIFCLIGAALMIVATYLFYSLNMQASLAHFILAFVCFGISIAIFFTANIRLIMQHALKDEAGIISSCKASASYFGGVIGFSLFAQMLANVVSIQSYKSACGLGIFLACIVLILCLLQKDHSVRN